MDEIKLPNMSYRQKQILEAVNKMVTGKRMYEEGQIEFEQLTDNGVGKKPINEVTAKVRKLIVKPKRAKQHKVDSNSESITIRVIKYIRENGPSTRNTLMRKLNIGWTTAQSALKELVSRNLVHEEERQSNNYKTARHYILTPSV